MSRLRRLAGALVLMLLGSAGPGIPHGTPGPVAQGPPPAQAELVRVELALPPVTTTSSTSTTSPPRPPVTAASRGARRSTPPAPRSSSGARTVGLVRVTCYGPPQFPAGQHTATGRPVGPGSLAVDPRLIPLGSTVTLAGLGTFTADDTGGAIRGPHVDVWRPSCAGWPNPTVLATIG